MEQCLEALAETSMTAKQKLTLLAMVDDFVFVMRSAKQRARRWSTWSSQQHNGYRQLSPARGGLQRRTD